MMIDSSLYWSKDYSLEASIAFLTDKVSNPAPGIAISIGFLNLNFYFVLAWPKAISGTAPRK